MNDIAENTETIASTEEESVSVIDEKTPPKNSEGVFDVWFIQITICIILLILVAVANILESSITTDFLHKFKELTGEKQEEVFHRGAELVIRIIRD